MANDLAKTNPATEIDPYEKFSQTYGQQSFITGDLLRFTKHGASTAGQDQEEIEDGTRMLAFMPGLQIGQVRWENNQPVKHLIGLVCEGFEPPPRESLGDLDESKWPKLGGQPNDPWQETVYLPMLNDEGQLYTYVTSSKGGKSALAKVTKAYTTRRKMHPDEIPILQLNVTSYDHPQYGETFKPVFKIDGWAKAPADFDELKATLTNGNGADVEAIEDKSTTFPIKTAKVKEKEKPKTAPPPPARGRSGPKKGMRF
jgi:hypothetical protein